MGHGEGRGMGRHGGRGMPMSDPALESVPPTGSADVPTIGIEPEPEMQERAG